MAIHDAAFETRTHTLMLVVSAIALNQAIQISSGTLSFGGIVLLLVACITAIYSVLGRSSDPDQSCNREHVLVALGAGLSMQFAQLLFSPPGLLPAHPGAYVTVVFGCGVVVSVALVVWGVTRTHRTGRWFLMLMIVHFLMGVWFLRTSPPIMGDVLMFQRDAIRALLQGTSPYSVVYPNIYGDNTPFYAPSLLVDGYLTISFPYPPLSLLLCLPGYLLGGGDIRYSHLLAISLAGLLIGYSGKGLTSKLAAILYVFSPRAFFVAQMAWTEPFVVLALSVVIYLARRSGRSQAVALGLLFSTKQYLIFAAPVAWQIAKQSGREYAQLILKSAAVALAVTLPLALWNWPGFYRSVIEFQVVQPFRTDSLSIPALLVALGLPRLPIWLPFLVLVATGWASTRKRSATPASFASGLAVMYLAFFALNKQAFCNYYFFVVGCLCCAIAAADTGKAPQAV